MGACKEAKKFYDAVVALHYSNGQILYIKRLSGDDVSLSDRYINLSLTDDQEGKQAQADFSLQKRLKIQAPDSKREVSLETQFDRRKLRGHSEATPSRILIRGRAGVGKTTLCKKSRMISSIAIFGNLNMIE